MLYMQEISIKYSSTWGFLTSNFDDILYMYVISSSFKNLSADSVDVTKRTFIPRTTFIPLA